MLVQFGTLVSLAKNQKKLKEGEGVEVDTSKFLPRTVDFELKVKYFAVGIKT
jgi:hypothetical protein